MNGMIKPLDFYNCLIENQFDFFAGVPDSLLKELCLCIKDRTKSDRNIVAANEGNAVALACGYHIVSGKYGAVYMQNSGIGNAINPLLSLADDKVYEVPMLLIVGYRGEPGVKDEPQHIKQGELTLPLLDTMGIKYLLLGEEYEKQIAFCRNYIKENGKPIALVVRKNTFDKYEKKIVNTNDYEMSREEALEILIQNLTEEEYIVSTTGKTSREIYEIREKMNMGHGCDFLTVGSMGHASSLALGISLFTDKNIYCVDGDGALLMHMGGLAVALQNAKDNFKYILINNGCHESVGGQPTVAYTIDLENILKGFGFSKVISVIGKEELAAGILALKNNGKTALIVYTNEFSRADLGRPTTTPKENKEAFQQQLRSKA